MLRFAVYDSAQEISFHRADRFPVLIGRSPDADLRLVSPGIWDRHARITLDAENLCFVIHSEGPGVLSVNQERTDHHRLKPGDELRIGGAKIIVSFSAATQQSLGLREGIFWAIFVFLILVESAVLAYLRFG